MPEITLTDNHHEYFVDGKRVKWSVTKILSASGLSEYYPRDSWYLERGRIVHLATGMIDNDTLDWSTVDDRIRPHLDAYCLFKHQTGWKFDHSELMLYDPVHDFCGMLDRYAPLLDIKLGEDNEIQLGLYWHLLWSNGYNPKREAFSLKLNENGTYKLTQTKEPITVLRDVGLAGLVVAKWKERYGNGRTH